MWKIVKLLYPFIKQHGKQIFSNQLTVYALMSSPLQNVL